MKFFIGTTNPHKVHEIGAILHATGCEFEVTDPVDPEETESDFDGNAILKARVYAAHAKGLVISEDSGLVIPTLNGLPGPWSARFSECVIDRATWNVTDIVPAGYSREVIDRRNNERVLNLMRTIEMPRRAAMFKVVLVVARPDGAVLFSGVGTSNGWIADEMQGENGFGYDPIFVGDNTFEKTYAELDAPRKNLRSHRRKVLQEFQAWLGKFLKEQEK
ncbi:MAG: non-canonical purine NTP pyrophosphatase [Parcubacteria group bacterium]|nr:non-canonical purine NTP pyrophosphatase [Parcubacteria group bacterium]